MIHMSFSHDKHVGILAMEVYTPRTYVSQSKLESYNGVSPGKYTIGLGQNAIGLVHGDIEDVNSISLTVVHSLLEKYNIDPSEVGRLEVGTETLVDKSKSTKTVLMSLFESNTDIEGATVINACYGGTAALLNTFAWAESDGWDGRYGIVVAADIATYDKGPARPTSGAGAVAVLVGRDAPLAFSYPNERTSHASHVWDFFKPNHMVEYPMVNGVASQVCYYRALEDCYVRFIDKINNRNDNGPEKGRKGFVDAESMDYFVFHSPYNKLVRKSYGRLYLLDARAQYKGRVTERITHSMEGNNVEERQEKPLCKWMTKPLEETHFDKSLESVLNTLSAQSFATRLADANDVSIAVGNTYAASVFLGLASLVANAGRREEFIPGKTVVVFSYGSGSLATMYRLHIRQPDQTRFTIKNMVHKLNLQARLKSREEVDPSELDRVMEVRAAMHITGAPYVPQYTPHKLFNGTYYLKGIDKNWIRSYERVSGDC